MMTLFVRDAFANTPLRKLTARVHEDHQPERIGFRMEGLLREYYLVAGECVYGLLRQNSGCTE